MREPVIIHPGQTTWHVVELQSDPKRNQSFVAANAQPHMLRRILAPYTASHRIADTLRRRATGLSSLRLTLDPIHDAGQQLVIHAVLLTLPPIVGAR